MHDRARVVGRAHDVDLGGHELVKVPAHPRLDVLGEHPDELVSVRARLLVPEA